MNKIRDIVHTLAVTKGWHDDEETEQQYITRAVANLHGEVSELWESLRKGTLHEPCDKEAFTSSHLQDTRRLTCIEEELSDLIIRALDVAGRLHIDIEAAVMAKHWYNETRPYRHGGKRA